MRKYSDKIFTWLIRLFHEVFGLSPNQVSILSLIAGIVAAAVTALGFVFDGLLLMALSQVIDALDGGIARQYNLQSAAGAKLELYFDRTCEAAMFAALVGIGKTDVLTTVLAFVAIILVTLVEPYSHFDPGFKRFMLYFGWLLEQLFRVRGFEIAMTVIFFANLTVFAVGTIMAEYRLQREVDAHAIAERAAMAAAGLPLPPDDPPSLISRIASWF
jgi:phosphatidylglycerophosphate synthase